MLLLRKIDTSTAIPKYIHKRCLLDLSTDNEFPNKEGIYFGIEALEDIPGLRNTSLDP
jgi:hypothetical protein